MGIVIIAKTADFSGIAVAHVGLNTSIKTGLMSLHETRRSADKTVNNPAGMAGTITGSPTFSPASALVSPSNSLITANRPASGGLTLAAIVKIKNGGVASDGVFGSHTVATPQGSAWLLHYNRRVQLSAYSFAMEAPPLSGATTLNAHKDFTAADDGKFELVFGVLEDGVSMRLYHPKSASLASAAATGRYFSFDGAPPIRTCPIAAGGSHEIAMTAHWQRVLSPAEMDTFYGEMKAQYGRLGLAI